jgi:methyl-accepting chemotaxis protein
MNSILTKLWNLFISKLGGFASLIPIIADLLHVALKENDTVRITELCDELDDVCAAITHLTTGLRDAMEDGRLTGEEVAEAAKDLEQVIMEAAEMAK